MPGARTRTTSQHHWLNWNGKLQLLNISIAFTQRFPCMETRGLLPRMRYERSTKISRFWALVLCHRRLCIVRAEKLRQTSSLKTYTSSQSPPYIPCSMQPNSSNALSAHRLISDGMDGMQLVHELFMEFNLMKEPSGIKCAARATVRQRKMRSHRGIALLPQIRPFGISGNTGGSQVSVSEYPQNISNLSAASAI